MRIAINFDRRSPSKIVEHVVSASLFCVYTSPICIMPSFTCKISLRYSRERALSSLPHSAKTTSPSGACRRRRGATPDVLDGYAQFKALDGGPGERPAGRDAQLLANFVHELDDVWLGSGNRPGAVVPPSIVQIRRIPVKSGFRQKIPAKSKQILAKI